MTDGEGRPMVCGAPRRDRRVCHVLDRGEWAEASERMLSEHPSGTVVRLDDGRYWISGNL